MQTPHRKQLRKITPTKACTSPAEGVLAFGDNGASISVVPMQYLRYASDYLKLDTQVWLPYICLRVGHCTYPHFFRRVSRRQLCGSSGLRAAESLDKRVTNLIRFHNSIAKEIITQQGD